jgi:hypothetical protein
MSGAMKEELLALMEDSPIDSIRAIVAVLRCHSREFYSSHHDLQRLIYRLDQLADEATREAIERDAAKRAEAIR